MTDSCLTCSKPSKKRMLCDSCLKIVIHDVACIVDEQPLTGTLKQQEQAWKLFVADYNHLKENHMQDVR